MNSHLVFEIGSAEEARGRATVYLPPRSEPGEGVVRLLEVDGVALKEAIWTELLEGRLIAPDVFEPFYVRVEPFPDGGSASQVMDFSHKDYRDLLVPGISPIDESPEFTMERMVAAYTTLFRENIYLRLTWQLANEVFQARKRVPVQAQYVGFYKLAFWICSMNRALRMNDGAKIAVCRKEILLLQPEIFVFDIASIAETLEKGSGKDWLETASCIDCFFLALKKHFPIHLGGSYVHTKKEPLGWLEEDRAALLEEYFLSVCSEQYERAAELKQLIHVRCASRPLNGCSNP